MKRAKIGDIFEVVTPKGTAYIQYIAKYPKYGDLIRVFPGIYTEGPPDFSSIVIEHEYFVFYLVSLAVRHQLVQFVVNHPLPIPLPTIFRRRGYFSPDGSIRNWVIEESTGDRLTKEITSEERKFPIKAFINHEMLLSEILKGYHSYNDY